MKTGHSCVALYLFHCLFSLDLLLKILNLGFYANNAKSALGALYTSMQKLR